MLCTQPTVTQLGGTEPTDAVSKAHTSFDGCAHFRPKNPPPLHAVPLPVHHMRHSRSTKGASLCILTRVVHGHFLSGLGVRRPITRLHNLDGHTHTLNLFSFEFGDATSFCA